jgi:hypothetical protein
MAIVRRCDRCGEVFRDSAFFRGLIPHNRIKVSFETRDGDVSIDLCGKCRKELRRFLNNKGMTFPEEEGLENDNDKGTTDTT